MSVLSFSSFKNLIDKHRPADNKAIVVPVWKRRSADLLTPVSAFLLLRGHADYAFLLESVEGGEKLARYSFLGRNPYRILRARGTQVNITDSERMQPAQFRKSGPFEGNIFDALRVETSRFFEIPVPDLPRLRGGAVGYLGYDCVGLLENLPDENADDLKTPDAIWALYDTVAAFDHVAHQIVLMGSVFLAPDTDLRQAYNGAVNRIAELERDLSPGIVPVPEAIHLHGDVQCNVGKEVFKEAVNRAKKYIVEGDIFQVVLSQRFELSFNGDSFNLYRALRQVNPSPYLFFLKFPDFELVGSSPEVLVRVQDSKAEVLPIAGTRPRGKDAEEDDRMQQELLDDPKERAEHLMLVDLGRNDLGRVCEYNSIEVDRYAYIEKYSHVIHIVSSVSGQVAPQFDSIDVLGACFPAGTVSGAPKVRAMEIIDELETTRRGIYAGAVGYMGFNGDLDTCITIRTMLVRDQSIFVQAGAGIVADSDPDKEFDETINKARALRRAIEVASTELL